MSKECMCEVYSLPYSAHRDEKMLCREASQHPETNLNSHTPPPVAHIESMIAQLTTSKKVDETKPRLGKNEVDALEREFKKNPKPTTQFKRQFAEEMGVDLARINNWFQNRRAKSKQTKKQEDYEARQSQGPMREYSEPLIPNLHYANLPLRELTTLFSSPSTSPTPIAIYNSQYSDLTNTNMESLQQVLLDYHGSALLENSKPNFPKKTIPKEMLGGPLVLRSSGNNNILPSLKAHDVVLPLLSKRRNNQIPKVCDLDSQCNEEKFVAPEFKRWPIQSAPSSNSHLKSCNALLISIHDRQEDGQDDINLHLLDPMRQALVERIMNKFWLKFDHNWAAQITQCPGGYSSASGDSKDCDKSVSNLSSPRSQQKRQMSRDEDSADESGNKKPRRQRGGQRPPKELRNFARFACPFRKHDSHKYSIHSHRVCALTSWDTIARVKEHLYRNHKAAPYCKRCWKVFETEELLDSHSTVPASSICETVPGHPPEGITPKQVVELRSKSKPYSKQNEAERWKEVFRLLFPDEIVPSPYWEPIQEHAPSSPSTPVLMHYDDYMHRELPRLFRSRVEEVVRREMQPVEVSLLANLETLIRECQDQLSSGYRKTHMTEQQSEVSQIQPTGTAADPLNSANMIEHTRTVVVEKDQQLSSEFFDALIQSPPSQEEDYVLDFSISDADLFSLDQQSPSNSLSDSGYAWLRGKTEEAQIPERTETKIQ